MGESNAANGVRRSVLVRASTDRVHALELVNPGAVARAGVSALDALDALEWIAEDGSLRIVALASGASRSAVIGRADRATQRDGLRAGVPPADQRARRAAAETALWIALGARAAEVARVELEPRAGSALSALARDRVDLAWTEDDLALVPAQVVPWVTFGASSLPSPRGPVVIVARGLSSAADRQATTQALSAAIRASLLADDTSAVAHLASRRGWSAERLRGALGDSIARATRLSMDDDVISWLEGHAARLHRLGLLSQRVDVARACDRRVIERAERLAGGAEHVAWLDAPRETRETLAVAL